MKKVVMFIFVLFLVNSVNAAEVPEEKRLKVGMSFEEARVLLEEVGARETQLDMVYMGVGEEKLYFLPDNRHVSIVINEEEGRKVVTGLSSFRINAEVPKVYPGHWVDLQKDAKEIELNKLNLTIQPNSPVYLPGENIAIEVKFENVSDQDILLSTYDMNQRIQRELRLYSRWEGITYKIMDSTKYELPQITPKDFITLNPGESYSHKYVLKTVFQEDDLLLYKTVDTTQEGIKEFPLGEYNISLKYENQVCGFASKVMPLFDCDAIKADKRYFIGKLVQNSTKNFTLAQVPVPENMICWNDDSCTWVGVIPENMGKCGCYSTGYAAAVQHSIKEGLAGSDSIVECEAPPDPDNACFCRGSTCIMDVEWQYDR